MASVNAVIRVDIDASAANAGLQQMAAQMSRFNKGMVQGSTSMAAAQVAAAQRAQGALNRTGQWIASTGSMMTAAGRMHKQFDKGTMASWQQWRDTSKKNNLVNQMAAQRVRALQTQYVALGREVDGAQRVMKAQPTGMLRQWGAEAEFAHQKAVLLNRRMTMGANSMINWGKNTQWAGRQMMVGMGIPLGIAAMGAVKSYKEMETAAISFKRVYGDATTSAGEKAKMLGVIQNGVGQEMTKYGIAVADTVGIAAKAAATGQQGDKLVTATRETMRLATLGQMDYDTALQSTIATQTAFGVSQKGMVRTTDFLNAAENQTVLSMEDMAKAIPRVAPVIKGLGGDVEDLAVLMTALRAGGVTAEQGANALKSGLGSLINPTSGATEAMEKFGIPLDKIVKTNKGDLIGTVQDFGKALHELPKFEQQQALEALFGKYQYARMGALFNNINKDQARETARLSKDSAANLAKISEQEMSQISDSAMNKFQGAIERLKAAAAPLGESILGGLAPLVDGLSNVIGFFANNDAARNVALFAGAFAGLAGVGVMLTGVFANFFGTMMKGYLGLKNIGRRMMGRPSLAYSGLDELEASAAQRQLAAAAEGATASLYGEKGAVNQLTAALNAMNAELRESVGLKAAATGAGKRPPGGGAVVAPTKPTPPTTPSALPPRMVLPPGGPGQRNLTTPWQRTHVGAEGIPLTKAQIASMKSGGSAAVQRAAAGFTPGKSMGYSGRTLLLPADLNAYWNDVGKEAPKAMAASALHHAGVSSLEPMFKTMGLDTSNPEIQRRAAMVHEEILKGVAGQSSSTISQVGLGTHLDSAMNKVFADDPKILQQYARTGLLNAVDTDQGRKVVTSKAGGAGLPFYQSGNARDILQKGGFSGVSSTSGAASAAASALTGSASALNGAAGALRGAAAALGGSAKAGAKAGVVSQRGFTAGTTGPYRSALGYTPNTDRIASRIEAGRASQYSKGYFAQQAQLERSQREATKKQSLWNRMRYGGAFSGGTRGMDSDAKLLAKDKMKSGVSNKLFAMGMAADAVTMGLAMTGHEIPAWTHAIGMSAMALGMFPGAITPIVSMLSNPVTGALAAIAAVVGSGVVAWKFVNSKAAEAGEAAGNYAVASNQTTEALAAQYGNQTLAQQVELRRAANASGSSVEDVQQSRGAVQSEIGQQITQGYADAVARTGSISGAQESMVNNLASAVFQKAMTVGQARAFASESLGDVQGTQVGNQLNSMIGKNGQLITKDPTGFATDSLLRNREIALDASAKAIESQSDFWTAYGNQGGEIIDFGSAFDSDAGGGIERVNDFFAGLTNMATLGVSKEIEGAGEQSLAGTEANAYAATVWSNSLQSGYATRTAAEERLRLVVQARNKAQKDMVAAEKSNPTGYRQDKNWQEAAKQVEGYNKTIARGNQGLREFDKTYSDMAQMSNKSFAELAKDGDMTKQNQYLESQRTAMEAMYSQNPAMMAAHVMEQQQMQWKAEDVSQGNPQELAKLMYAYQTASLTGLAPGSMGALDQLTGGQGLESLPGLMDVTSGGALGEVLTMAQGFKGDKNILGNALLDAKTGPQFSNLKDKLGEFVQLGPKAQQALDGAFGDASAKQIKSWGNQLESNKKTVGEVASEAAANQNQKAGGDPKASTPTPTRKDPASQGKPQFTNPLNQFKPNANAAANAGRVEGKAKGAAMSSAMQSTVMSKVQGMNRQSLTNAKTIGTQQGKVQGAGISAGIGASLGKSKTQATRALGSLGKGSKAGSIKLKVDDGGATAKINKVKSAMGKLKGGKGGDIKLKATDNASSKIQKVTSKAKQLKNAKTDIKIKASDNASAKLTKVKAKANALKNAKANIPIKAEDNASPKLSEVKSKAANLQGLNINVPIKATDNASAPANQAKTAITAVGQLAPNPTINANAAPAIVGAAMATAAIAAIPSSKTVTINVVKTGAIAGGGLIDSVYLAGGGEPTNRGIFTGRRVSGPGGPTEDKVPAWLSAGEFVMRAAAVKRYGSGFMYNVNAMKFDKGGKVGNDQGGNEEDSKKKGSDDSGGKEDKDTGWKDWTKEVKKLSKSWDKASKLAVKMKVSNPLLASLFGTGSPNAIGKFNPKKSKQIKKQFKKKQLMESLQATFDTLSENEKMAKAAQARVKLLKKHKGLSEDINRLEADELLAIKKSKNSKAVLKKVMKARNAASDAMFAQEWQSFADESTQSQALNAKRVELANSQKNPEYKKLMLQLTDEEVKQYNATKPGKREQFLIRRRKAMLAQEAFEKEVAKEERLSDLRGQKDFSNRFSNKEFQSLAIESPAAAAGMTEEDYEILQSLSGNELEKFRKALIEAADAANKTSRATELLNKKAEYAAMTLGQQFQEGTELLNQKSQAMRDEQAAIGEQKIVEATGKTRNQLEAEIGTRGVEVSRFQHQQELEQRHMDDINEKYNEQAKLLDDISQSQQIISTLQRGRLSVASALSSGDIAAAAAAAQEQRASEAQASIDMMKSALEKERDDRLKEHQDRIDEAQDSIDTLNDQIFEYQHAMDSIAATYALIGADTSVNIDKLNTSLQAQSGYWAAVTKDIDEYINALREVNPNVLKLPEPSQTTDNNNNNNNNNNEDDNTTPPPLTPKQKKAVKIADRVEKKAIKAMDKAQDAKKAAKKTQTKKDDKKAKKAMKKAEKIEGLADKADKVALTGDVGKAKELNQNAKQKLENVNNKVGSVNVVAAKAISKDANKKVDSLQDKLKAAKEEDDKKKSKALAEKLEKAKEDAKKAENDKQQAQAAAKKKADDDEKARQKKKKDDDDNRKKQSQEAEKQRKKKEEDNKKAQAQNKNKKNNGGFITKKYAGGGFVGGVGNTDKVPALLTPGEFVMTKGSAARYGKALEKVNSPSYKFASNAAGYSGGSAMGTSIYNLTVNAQTNADANDIATITIKRIQDMERTRIRERKV